jgi:Na+/phosphate symporter
MLALAAAAVFALALILDWANTNVSDAFTPQTLMFVGLLLLALHLGGVGAAYKTRARSRR